MTIEIRRILAWYFGLVRWRNRSCTKCVLNVELLPINDVIILTTANKNNETNLNFVFQRRIESYAQKFMYFSRKTFRDCFSYQSALNNFIYVNAKTNLLERMKHLTFFNRPSCESGLAFLCLPLWFRDLLGESLIRELIIRGIEFYMANTLISFVTQITVIALF